MNRHRNRGLRKICNCPRRTWAKCPHSWHFNFKPKGGPSYRFSVDSEAGKRIEAKGDAEGLADGWRTQIRAGTFRRRTEPQVAPSAAATELTLASSERRLGLIRFRGHLPKGGYDVPTDGRHFQEDPAPAPAV
jgi:hypothetical protein